MAGTDKKPSRVHLAWIEIRLSARRASTLLLAFLPLSLTASPTIPDTPAGEIFTAWLDSFNSGDPQKVEAFKKTYERKNEVQDVLDWREANGGFELLRIEESDPSRLIVLIREVETERALRCRLTVTGDSKGDNLSIALERASTPPEFAPPRLLLDAALGSLSQHADALARADKFAGVLLLARNGDVLLEKAWGQSDRAAGKLNALDTQFRLGSMNKMFTAVAVLQLVERGALSLDAPIGGYLSHYPNKDVATKVTIRHLLNHSGGTGDIFGSEFEQHRLSLKEHGDYVKLYGVRALEYEPGAQDSYSNYGYVLLGAIIEAVSDVSYYEYVRNHIYKPAGMDSTASLPESVFVPRRAVGYMKDDGKWISNAETLPYRGMAAGGGYSTARDLLRFAQALESGKMLSKRMLTEAIKPQDFSGTYGYGFGVEGDGILFSFGHGGGAPGMNGQLRVYPKLGYVLVALSNLDPPAASRMVDYFAARMPVE